MAIDGEKTTGFYIAYSGRTRSLAKQKVQKLQKSEQRKS